MQLNGSRKVIGVLRGYDVSQFMPDPRKRAHPSLLGFLKHRTGRGARGEGWWREDQTGHGGKTTEIGVPYRSYANNI